MATLNFNALRDLHNSANNLLHSPVIKQVLVRKEQAKCVNEVSEASLKMLDVCGISKDVLLLVKQHLQDLQFTLRKVSEVGESDNEMKIAAYDRYRKKLRRETSKCLNSLKGMRRNSVDVSKIVDCNLMVVVEVLSEIRVAVISAIELLLTLISIPWLDRKLSSKGSFVSFFTRSNYKIEDEMVVYNANKRLEAVEIAIEELEDELECMFRRLIQTRVSLLNILTN